jgi:GNAT superfamily N-acetyltransferase
MSPQGYRLAYLAVADVVRAVVGYRIIEMLRTGRMLEIDGLISDTSERSKDYGKQLLDWCYELAGRSHCSVVELDSAVHRSDAHPFYFRERMHVLAFPFNRRVT